MEAAAAGWRSSGTPQGRWSMDGEHQWAATSATSIGKQRHRRRAAPSPNLLCVCGGGVRWGEGGWCLRPSSTAAAMHVLGVIPRALLPHEISGEAKTVADMYERKSEMAKHADAFIALPGGYGTMEELLEMIVWSQLGIHEKPVGLLNVDGYHNSLLALFDKVLQWFCCREKVVMEYSVQFNDGLR